MDKWRDPILKATVKFQIDRTKCQVRIRKQNFKTAVILFFHMKTNFESNLVLMVPYPPIKFQIDWLKQIQVRVGKLNFKMAAILYFEVAPISKAT